MLFIRQFHSAKSIAAGCSKLFGFGLFLRIAILGTARFRLHYAAANGSQVAADSLPPYTIFRPAAKSFSFFDGNESGYAL